MKLVQLLKNLQANELKAFEDFLDSPFFIRSDQLCNYFKLVKISMTEHKDAEDFPEEMLKGTEFEGKDIHGLNNRLLNQLRQFIIYYEFQQDETAQDKYLLEFFTRKESDPKEVFGIYEKVTKKWDRMGENPDLYHDRFELELDFNYYNAKQPRKGKTRPISTLDHYLNSYFLVRKLDLACAAVIERSVHGKADEVKEIDNLIGLFKEDLPPLGEIYYLIYQLFSKESPEDAGKFTGLMATIREHVPEFSNKTTFSLYQYVLNYCVRKINLGEMTYQETLSGIYEDLLESKMLLQNNRITPGNFERIIHLNCRTGNLSRAESFFDEFKDRLTDEHEGYSQLFGKGMLDFYRGNYDRAIIDLNLVLNYKRSYFYGLGSRAYLMMALYKRWEPGDEDAFTSLCHSFKRFITFNENKDYISPGRKERYNNFINSIKKLASITREPKPNLKKLKTLRKLVNGEPLLAQKPWLLDEIDSFF